MRSGARRDEAEDRSDTMTEILRKVTQVLSGDGPLEARLSAALELLRDSFDYDATAVLHKRGTILVPLASVGLLPEIKGRRFVIADEPRLQQGLVATKPVRFAPDSPLHDPYDGLLLGDTTATARMHACWVVPLIAEGAAIGVLTLDSKEAGALDSLDTDALDVVAAVIASVVHASVAADTMRTQQQQQQTMVHFVRRDLGERLGDEFLGVSPAVQRIRSEITMVAKTDLPVLITGETGTGKEVVARAIYGQSARNGQVMLHLNCAALPEAIAEDELFGHVRGSFTGADRERLGKFEAADGGTLFLDEIGELPLSLQPKLLRVLQSGEIQRVGTDHTRHVDVRIIAATNRRLDVEVEAGRFRADLYHRLAVFSLWIPPLRDRPDDIDLYCGYFLDKARLRLGTGPLRLDSEARIALHEYPWPGNVREMEHILLRAALSASKCVSRGESVVIPASELALPCALVHGDLGSHTRVDAETAPVGSLREVTDGFQRRVIAAALDRHDGNWSAAARELDVDRANLKRLAQRLGIHTH